MLTIRKEQMAAFSSACKERFIKDMVNHAGEYFPNHLRVITEPQIRHVIQYAIERAGKFGFESERNVCMYLNCMLILGSNFDSDPQYPWVSEILNHDGKPPDALMDALSNKALDVFHSFAGKDQSYMNRALITADRRFEDILSRTITEDPTKDIHNRLKNLYPQKYRIVGEEAVSGLIESSAASIRRYDIYSEGNQLQYSILSFMIGSGFSTDPQFPWAHRILTDNGISSENEKMDLLCHEARIFLKEFMDQT